MNIRNIKEVEYKFYKNIKLSDNDITEISDEINNLANK